MLSLILPAYNEARRLPASLARCAEFLRARGLAAEVIVADDGSTDATAAAYVAAVEGLPRARLRYRYLDLAHRGKGNAVRSGVRAASGDPIVVLDADLTIPVEKIDAFLAILRDGADIAVASRHVPASGVNRPWWRVAKDARCGGRMYTAEAARDLFASATMDGTASDAEVLFIARRRGYRVVETPVEIRWGANRSAAPLRDSAAVLRDLLVIEWNALRGRYA